MDFYWFRKSVHCRTYHFIRCDLEMGCNIQIIINYRLFCQVCRLKSDGTMNFIAEDLYIILSRDNYNIIDSFISRNKHIRFMKFSNVAFKYGNSMRFTFIFIIRVIMFYMNIYNFLCFINVFVKDLFRDLSEICFLSIFCNMFVGIFR